jgi:hypothetical protein
VTARGGFSSEALIFFHARRHSELACPQAGEARNLLFLRSSKDSEKKREQK